MICAFEPFNVIGMVQKFITLNNKSKSYVDMTIIDCVAGQIVNGGSYNAAKKHIAIFYNANN